VVASGALGGIAMGGREPEATEALTRVLFIGSGRDQRNLNGVATLFSSGARTLILTAQ